MEPNLRVEGEHQHRPRSFEPNVVHHAHPDPGDADRRLAVDAGRGR